MKLYSLLFLLLVAAVSFAAERTYEKKIPAVSGGTLTVEIDGGSITVVGADTKEVSVVARLQGRERDINEYAIEAFEGAKGVELRGKGRESSWFRWWDDRNVEMHVSITVPLEYNTILNTSGGDIEITKLSGSKSGGTSGGNIIIDDVKGDIRMETSGGDVRVQRVMGNTTMGTSGGNITIADVQGDVDASTSGGDVRVTSVEGKIRAESSGGNIVVSVRNENKGVYAETSGGDIDITLSPNASALLDASTSGGEVSCDLPVTMKGTFDEQRLRGNINGGGNPIHAHTSGGDVRIRPAQ